MKKNKLYNREEQQKKDRVVNSPLIFEEPSIEEVEEWRRQVREEYADILRDYEVKIRRVK